MLQGDTPYERIGSDKEATLFEKIKTRKERESIWRGRSNKWEIHLKANSDSYWVNWLYRDTLRLLISNINTNGSIYSYSLSIDRNIGMYIVI